MVEWEYNVFGIKIRSKKYESNRWNEMTFSTLLGPINPIGKLCRHLLLSQIPMWKCITLLHLSVLLLLPSQTPPLDNLIISSPFFPFSKLPQSPCHGFVSSTFYFLSLFFFSYASKDMLLQVTPTSSSIGLSPTSLLLHLDSNRRFLLFIFLSSANFMLELWGFPGISLGIYIYESRLSSSSYIFCYICKYFF